MLKSTQAEAMVSLNLKKTLDKKELAMNCFYRLVLCSVVIFQINACSAVNIGKTVELLNDFKIIMQKSNNAALKKAQEKATLYDRSCSSKESINDVLLAGATGAHEDMKAIMGAMQNLGEMGVSLRAAFKDLCSNLLVSEKINTVEQAIKNIELHNNQVLEIIEQAKANFEQA